MQEKIKARIADISREIDGLSGSLPGAHWSTPYRRKKMENEADLLEEVLLYTASLEDFNRDLIKLVIESLGLLESASKVLGNTQNEARAKTLKDKFQFLIKENSNE